ncbi:TRAP transporter small permease [Acuticoccus sp. MNP-M23]|uniref:TRAP transporter small permease n=1 Tax=Acuticoccus sp. MNP-M23 TaxID=3072793 RepID=UPI0028155ACC|nr:TRAP transporter small permease [Acuticoccus sp. MNP-M23]WMS42648.1 TRAP transporter small permease [Acuticoccus sp. MNP-M23]
MRRHFARFVDGLNVVASWVCYALLVVITAITCLQVFLRFVLNNPTSWSEEVALLCLIWFGMLAIAVGIRRHEHVAISFFRDMLPYPLALTLDFMAQLLTAGFMLVVVVYGQDLVALAGKQLLPASSLSKAWLYVPTLVGGALGTFNAISNILLRELGNAPITAMEPLNAG